MKEHLLPQHQQTYIPAVAITRATLKHSWSKIPITTSTAPDRICGEARRIGYTGKQDSDFALYRLKVKMGNGLPTVTLPSFYVIDKGLFIEYE